MFKNRKFCTERIDQMCGDVVDYFLSFFILRFSNKWRRDLLRPARPVMFIGCTPAPLMLRLQKIIIVVEKTDQFTIHHTITFPRH